MTHPIYAIGDLHGQLAALEQTLEHIAKDGGPDAQIVFLGDYTDRGPDSKALLDLLIAGQHAGRNWQFLLGNHDRMFRWFMEPVPRHDPHLPINLYWLHPRLGGDTTLASYGIEMAQTDRQTAVHAEALQKVPQAHIDFLHGLKTSIETDQLFFAHAGIRPGIALADQSEHDLIWIRQEFYDDPRIHPKLIVHGHTPVDQATHYGNRINLDSGAGYGKPLSAAVFEGRRCWLLGAEGRQALAPA